MSLSSDLSKPRPWFSVFSSTAVIVGIVVGIGIFRLPPLVAANSATEWQFILLWVAGGFISLMGALCYAELSSSLPNTGGEYYFLSKAYGSGIGFLLSWGRMTVIQTGSVALISFILGDYLSLIYSFGSYSSSIYAAMAVVGLTAINVMGTAKSGRFQNVITSVVVSTALVLAVAGLLYSGQADKMEIQDSSMASNKGAIGLAMIFVLLTFGGWSEAAYISGEVYNVKRNIVWSLVIGVLIITTIYILMNLSYLNVIGFENLKNSETVGYDLTERVFGEKTSILVVLIIILSALSTANATIITGARTNYSIGRDYRPLRILGVWNSKRNSPINALIFQAIICFILIGIGTWSKQAINTMVDYTAPVFWFFLTLTTFSLFIFRFRKATHKIAFRVPLYPLPPLLFLAACLYMLYSSVSYTGIGALIGLSILLAGVPVFLMVRRNGKS